MVVGKPNLIKRFNTDVIHGMIVERGPISKPELAAMTKLSLPTVNRVVDELTKMGLVREEGVQETGYAGRRAKTYVSNDDVSHIVALFYTAGGWLGGICNLAGHFETVERFTTSTTDIEQSLTDLQIACERLAKSCKGTVLGVGLGIPGVVQNDTVTSIPQIPCWEGVQLKEALEERCGLPCFIENDVKLMTAGYYARECPKSCENLLFLSVGHGLGSGMMINRKLYKGAGCFAGECGYMILNGEAEPTRQASLETEICGLAERIEAGDDSAYARYYRLIAQIIANFITVIDPQRIALQGICIDKKGVGEIENEIRKYLPCKLPPITVVNDEKIGLYGAYRLCFSSTNSQMRVIEQRGI